MYASIMIYRNYYVYIDTYTPKKMATAIGFKEKCNSTCTANYLISTQTNQRHNIKRSYLIGIEYYAQNNTNA